MGRLNIRRTPLPGWLLAIGGGQFFISFVVNVFSTRNYSYISGPISDLGARGCLQLGPSNFCPAGYRLIDGSFVTLGLLSLAGLVLLMKNPPSRFWRAGLLFLCITSICVVLVGLFPVNTDLRVHTIASDIAFPTGVMGIIALVLSRQLGTLMSGYSLLTAVMSLGAQSVHFATGDSWRYAGLAERLAAGPLVLWIVVFGIWLIIFGPQKRPG